MMDDAMLRADCSACAGLCCVALAFDRSALFAFDKAAGEPCRHLGAGHRCAIHATRERQGMAGCTRYDCYGAGQRVTAMFAGRSWRDDGRTARLMFGMFGRVRRAHELVALLRTAASLPLPDADEAVRAQLETRLAAIPSVLEVARLDAEARAFFGSLRHLVVRQRRSFSKCRNVGSKSPSLTSPFQSRMWTSLRAQPMRPRAFSVWMVRLVWTADRPSVSANSTWVIGSGIVCGGLVPSRVILSASSQMRWAVRSSAGSVPMAVIHWRWREPSISVSIHSIRVRCGRVSVILSIAACGK